MVAKKTRDVDQDVPSQGIDLSRVVGQVVGVFRQGALCGKGHAAHGATHDGRRAVVGEIDTSGRMQQPDDFRIVHGVRDGQHVLGQCIARQTFFDCSRHGQGRKTKSRNLAQLLRDIAWAQHVIDVTLRDRTLRHARVFGRIILGEGDAPGGLDRREAEGAVRAGTRQNHPNSAPWAVIGQRAQKAVDSVMQPWSTVS